MRARGMLAFFGAMLLLSAALPGQAGAQSEWFSNATNKIKNVFGVSKPPRPIPTQAPTRTSTKQSARPTPKQTAAEPGPEAITSETVRAQPMRAEPVRTNETSAKEAAAKKDAGAKKDAAAGAAAAATIGSIDPSPALANARATTEVGLRDTGPNRVVEPSRALPATPLPRAPAGTPAGFNAYEEILGYALWPQDYTARFWSRGYGDIIGALVTSPPAPAANTDNRKDRRRSEGNDSVVAGMCVASAEDQANRTIARLSETFESGDTNRKSLQDLRAALTEAVKRGKAACTAAMPPTPAGRLKIATEGLWVMRDTNILFRTPLASFYTSLTAGQKAQWNRLATAGGKQGDATVCSTGGSGLPVDAIEQSIRPTPEQRSSFAALRQISNDMAGYLSGSCPDTLPLDPVDRLDAVGNRVNALLYAVMLFDQTLTGFYLQLSSDQKATFDKVGGRY